MTFEASSQNGSTRSTDTTTDANESATSSRCPVAHDRSPSTAISTPTPTILRSVWNPMRWIPVRTSSLSPSSEQSPAPPFNATSNKNGATMGECPVKHDSSGSAQTPTLPFANSNQLLPSSLEESARHAQTPLPDQTIPLSTLRAISTIPRADELRDPITKVDNVNTNSNKNQKHAPHQPSVGQKWVYPSEQQFYNAMRRKGWDADESTIPTVVQIHNAVNEKGWSQIRKWEAQLHANPNPRLVKFLGRPKDTSPKAWINTNLFFYKPPFDRHDWYIDRGDGKEPQRYVIDFYNGQEQEQQKLQQVATPLCPPSMYLDVRPALDTPKAAKDRVHMFFRDAFPGIFGAYDGLTNSSGTPSTSSVRPTTTHLQGTEGANK